MKSYRLILLTLLVCAATAISSTGIQNKNLISAIKAKHLGMTARIISEGVDINYEDGAPLTEAINVESVPLVKLMLDKGAQVNLWNHGLTPLMVAASKGNPKIVSLLLEHGADWNVVLFDQYCDTDMACFDKRAVDMARTDEVKKILEGAQRKQDEIDKHLVEAIKQQDRAGIIKAIEQKADINRWENHLQPIDHAVRTGNIDIVKLLQAHGVNINIVVGRSILCQAVLSGNGDMVQLVLDAGFKVDDDVLDRKRALHYAAERGDLGMTRLLLDHGANPNPANKWEDYTPLMAAAKGGNPDVIHLLIKAGARLNKEKKGKTALDYASNEKAKKILNDAIAAVKKSKQEAEDKKQADERAQNLREQLVEQFLSAARDGDVKQLKDALKKGVNVDDRGSLRQTALIEASLAGHQEVILILLQYGADKSLRDNFGKTALSYAETDLIKQLLQ